MQLTHQTLQKVINNVNYDFAFIYIIKIYTIY